MLEVRPGWREPLNLFTVVAMPPGSRKSAVFAAMTGPLLDAERALIEQTRPAIIQAELARKVHQRDAERHTTAAGDAHTPQVRDQALADAADAALDAENTRVPALPRLVADDVTPEAAASLLAEQGGRLAVLSAEGGIFATMAGRYSGGVPSLEVFLKGHAGDLLRVDRKARPAEHVDRAGPDPRPRPATRGAARHRRHARLPRPRPARPHPVLTAREHRRPPPGRRRGRPAVGRPRLPPAASARLSSPSPATPTRSSCGSPPRRTNGSSTSNAASNRAWRRKPTSATSPTGPPNSSAPPPGSPACFTSPEHLRTGWSQPIPANHVDAAARLGALLPRPRPRRVRHHERRPHHRRRPRRPALDRKNQPNRVQPTRRLHRALPITVPEGRRPRPRPHPAQRPWLHQNPPAASTHRRQTCVPDLGGSSAGRRNRRNRISRSP